MAAGGGAAERFTAAMRAAVEERGAEWRYPDDDPDWHGSGGMCIYRLDDGSPACLVGAALAKLGLLEEVPVSSVDGAQTLMIELGFDHDVAFAADLAQGAQDMGDTWGEALDEYLAAIESEAAA